MTARQIQGEFVTVGDVLAAAAAANGDAEAYVEPGTTTSKRRRLTFAEWDSAADGVAGLFARSGVGRGSVVCLMLPSSIDYMVCYAAAFRLGAVTSGINLRLGAAEVSSIVGRTDPAVTVTDTGGQGPPGRVGVVLGRPEVRAAWSGRSPRRRPSLARTDPVAVVWTSGTTGLPKGAVFDHGCLAAVAAGTDVLSEPGDRRLSPLPFSHVGSMTRVWDEMVTGVTTVITPTPWRAAEAVAVMAEERISVAQGVPTQWALVLSNPGLGEADLGALRIVATGAAPVPPELVASLRERFGVPVVVRYTSTEASLGTGTAPGDPDDVVAATVGRPVPGVELEVVDAEGHPLAGGEVGRIRLRSAAVIRGYWGGPPSGPGASGVVYDRRATAAVLADDGWLATGDSGLLDAEGCLRLVGRSGDRYIRGGYNVYPAEVEGVLGGHPAVDQVAVVGAPDPVLGEIGVAFVVPSAGGAVDEVGLLAAFRELSSSVLADYKAPDRLVLVDRLPLTAMMKVDRRPLAARAASLGTHPGAGAAPPRDHRRPAGFDGVRAS